MKIEFNPAKDRLNIRKHGVSLARAVDFQAVNVLVDDRYAYGETRYRAWGHINGQAHCLAYTVRGEVVRPISLRRAHRKEMERYG